MKNFVWRSLKLALRSRVVYLLVVANLCFVAYEVRSFPFDGHGLANCVIPKVEIESLVSNCSSFRPPPPFWKIAVAISNLPPVAVGVIATESLERVFPQLCGLMTFINLSVMAVCISLYWLLIGSVISWICRRIQKIVLQIIPHRTSHWSATPR